MAIPPFPSEDLAKLVLGYLAEEQLMTAYDEFLQSSPYLDVSRNEYDRIFMTSLKTILAEYRAVKIYVESCKPFLLRKKLMQCANILEIVRFLVDHVDVNKLPNQSFMQKVSARKIQRITPFPVCDVCISLQLPNCVCKPDQPQVPNYQAVNVIEKISLANLVETTSLADLPGSHVRKRNLHISDCTLTQSHSACLMSEQLSKQSHSQNNFSMPIIEDTPKPLQINLSHSALIGSNLTDSKQKTEFNNVLTSVCKTNTVKENKRKRVGKLRGKGKAGDSGKVTDSENVTDSFQEFTSGVRGYQNENQNSIATVSITAEYSANSLTGNHTNNCRSTFESSNPQLLLKVEPISNNLNTQDKAVNNVVNNNYPYARVNPTDQKIKILSDVKVDNSYKINDKIIKIPINNAASTPLMKMQTIVINGNQAYKSQPIKSYQQTYSRDEIMAMPTIIVVPSSDGHKMPVITQTEPVIPESISTINTQSNLSNKLRSPLVIDITQPSLNEAPEEALLTKENKNNVNNTSLIKTVVVPTDFKKSSEPNSSVPKDTATFTSETNTPQIVPLIKKSSSTPRRTSHIRVLDFTTPRRILSDAIDEQNYNETKAEPVEVVISDSPVTKTAPVNILDQKDSTLSNISCSDKIDCEPAQSKVSKPILPTVKTTWDSKLRAMIAASDNMYEPNIVIKSTEKENKDLCNTEEQKKKKSSKPKKAKKKVVPSVCNTLEQDKKVETLSIKPNIKIKAGSDWSSSSSCIDKRQSANNENKLIDEEQIETPEVDRISLQNVVGAKLNISELLETPYKQALYDIQMETPRGLGLELPGEPMSDIKIMNIPTPRFFDSPKIMTTTPNYSSRPTDYSSGSSYYKPDDQDFIPSTDLKLTNVPSKKDIESEPIKENPENRKHSRPVRKCTKNVSYYNIVNMKDIDDKIDAVSSCSESLNPISIENKNVSHSSQEKPGDTKKSEDKKKSSKKRKLSVTKEKQKTFIKIKPRRVTPTKDTSASRIRKKPLPCSSPKNQRNRTTIKDKNMQPATCPIPTKSRRKSSTPRKLHCTKNFSSENHEFFEVNEKQNTNEESNLSTHESDAEQLTLHWSEDGSQDKVIDEAQTNTAQETDEISKIQEYIETTVVEKQNAVNDVEVQKDMTERSFDLEIAKNIERDLLDTPPHNDINRTVLEKPINPIDVQETNTIKKSVETNCGITSELHHIDQGEDDDDDDDDDDDEIELSSHDCNEENSNFIHIEYDESKEILASEPVTLKENYTMEICIDDDVTIRLRATPFCSLYDHNCSEEEKISNTEEVASLTTNDNIVDTPYKDSIKSQMYDIFDSTLTSLDTPLKVSSSKTTTREMIINTIVLEEEESDSIEKLDQQQKRKRRQSDESDETLRFNKKNKSDTQYLLSTTHIQDIDIETVLTKLHGP